MQPIDQPKIPPTQNSAPQRDSRSHRLVIFSLLFANLLPLLGVVVWRWDVRILLITYWFENVIIGFYSLLRIMAGGEKKTLLAWLTTVGIALFFSVHYGAFCWIHGLFVDVITKSPLVSDNTSTENEELIPINTKDNWTSPFLLVQIIVRIFTNLINNRQDGRVIAWAALFLSHGVSFVINFLRSGQWRHTNPIEETFKPYPRIIMLHLTIIFGALPAIIFGSPLSLLIILVVVKTSIDLIILIRQIKK